MPAQCGIRQLLFLVGLLWVAGSGVASAEESPVVAEYKNEDGTTMTVAADGAGATLTEVVSPQDPKLQFPEVAKRDDAAVEFNPTDTTKTVTTTR